MPLIAQERAVSYTGAVYPEHDICSGFFVSRKPRDSRVVQKSLSGEKDKKTPNVLK